MINSLQKDSHITRYIGHRNSQSLKNSINNNIKNAMPENNFKKTVKKPAQMTFGGFLNSEKPLNGILQSVKKFDVYTNPKVKRFFELAHDNPAVFNAFFSLGLTCILRPASIMVLPTSKKNKTDNKYAAAHSIASGIIAYALSVVILSPISNAVKKVGNNLTELVKNPKLTYLQDEKTFAAAQKVINMVPETFIAAPRAAITIALIPPILKYVFGWEKKKKNNDINAITNNYMILNFKGINNAKFAAFKGNTEGVK
jgi:hypothetical protein